LDELRRRLIRSFAFVFVPLVLLGLVMLWVVWGAKEQQLNESLEQQAELSAVVFDRWLDAQRQPLVTIASYPAEQFREAAALEADLRAATARRPHWIDVRVLDAGGCATALKTQSGASIRIRFQSNATGRLTSSSTCSTCRASKGASSASRTSARTWRN
jgi:hypothetical protein